MRRLTLLASLAAAAAMAAIAGTSLGIVAGVAAGAVLLGGAAWYARGRWLRRRRDVQRVRERADRAVRQASVNPFDIR